MTNFHESYLHILTHNTCASNLPYDVRQAYLYEDMNESYRCPFSALSSTTIFDGSSAAKRDYMYYCYDNQIVQHMKLYVCISTLI